MNWSRLGFSVLHYLLEFAQTQLHWVDDVTQPSHPLLPLSALLSIFHSVSSQHFASGGQIIGFSISPSSGYSGLISLRRDWLDLLAVQRTLDSPLQHHHSKASILWHIAFFMFQVSYPYMNTAKNSFDYAELCQ